MTAYGRDIRAGCTPKGGCDFIKVLVQKMKGSLSLGVVHTCTCKYAEPEMALLR